jgi:nucleotide-binding universal stress UspA family protein
VATAVDNFLDRLGRKLGAWLRQQIPGHEPVVSSDPAALGRTLRPADVLLAAGGNRLSTATRPLVGCSCLSTQRSEPIRCIGESCCPRDGTELCERAIRHGIGLAKFVGAKVVAVTVTRPLHSAMPRSLIPKNLARVIHSETVKAADEKLAVIEGVDPLFAYDANYLIDNKFGIILDAEGTRANRSDEVAIAEIMVDRVERRFDLKPERLAGDTVYGAARLLKWLWDRGITPHVPVWDKSARADGKFSRADFVFDKERNVYICPAGAELTHSGVVDQGRILPFRASTSDCSICKLKPRCTTAVARKVSRDIDEDVRDQVRALADTEAFQLSCRERKKVEVRFAHMKRILKLDRLRLRGLSGARDEVLLTATAQNLRRLARLICRSPPPTAECTA